MEIFYSFFKAATSAVLNLTRFAMSLRAKGVQFHPILSRNKDGSYLVEAWLTPGRDEVFFDTFKAKGFDISFPNNSSVYKDTMPIQAVVPSAFESAGEVCMRFRIRPRSDKDKALLVLKGGWLDQLNASRRLPKPGVTFL